jgi:tetratricopeptide (TPR) repeat protein
MQQKALQEIATVLQAPLDTQAKELRRRAEFAYQNGWYQEALADFLQAEKQNYQDFMVHQSIANIYLYHERPANLDLSRDYYLKAAKYSLPVSKYHSALAHMYAGFVCYLQRDNIAAIQNAARATEIYPQLTEAYFNHAKFSASAGQAALAIPSLEFAIRSDRKYALKARADSDFENIEVQVNELMTRLYTETRTLAESKVREIRSNRYLCQITKVKTALSNAEGYLQFNSYFGNLDAITAVASIDESVWLCYQDKYVSITTSSIIVDGQEFSLKKMRPVSMKGSFRGWSGRIVNHIDLVQSDGKKIYQISSEDRKWTEKIVIEINKVINSYR